MLLAGDVGGTKTILAICSEQDGIRQMLAEQELPSARYASLEDLVQNYLSRVDYTVDRAVFGVAGPVVDGKSKITNLPWQLDEAQLRSEIGLKSACLLNDLEAIAYVVPHLSSEDLQVINEGQARPKAPIAVLAPGTGLGQAFLTWDGQRYRAHSSEGGHVDFSPTDELQIGLLRFLRKKFGRVSVERVCSGIGLPNIYHYLKSIDYAEEPDWLAAELEQADDLNPVIVGVALDPDRDCALCDAALKLFVTVMGSEAGNLALKVLSTGGMYLGGGFPRRILPALQDGVFIQAFRDKGRMSVLLEKMPVNVILNTRAALLGAAAYGLDL